MINDGPRHSILTKSIRLERERQDPSYGGRKPVFQRFPGVRAKKAEPHKGHAASLLHSYRLQAVKDYRREWKRLKDQQEKRRYRDLWKLDLNCPDAMPGSVLSLACFRFDLFDDSNGNLGFLTDYYDSLFFVLLACVCVRMCAFLCVVFLFTQK